jgi:hypothetical protein
MAYVIVEDVAASWEHYRRFAEALSKPPPIGLIVHAAGPTDEGFRIVGVWESADAWRRFVAERLGDAVGADAGASPVVRSLRAAHIVIGQSDGARPV